VLSVHDNKLLRIVFPIFCIKCIIGVIFCLFQIHERLRAVQEEIVSSSEHMRAALVPLAKLHLTLMVMHLSDSDSDEQLTRCVWMPQIGNMGFISDSMTSALIT